MLESLFSCVFYLDVFGPSIERVHYGISFIRLNLLFISMVPSVDTFQALASASIFFFPDYAYW